MTVLLGLSHTGYRNFIKQNMFTVHYLRKNPGRALCHRRTPYQFRFHTLPHNAVLCETCRSSPTSP